MLIWARDIQRGMVVDGKTVDDVRLYNNGYLVFYDNWSNKTWYPPYSKVEIKCQ